MGLSQLSRSIAGSVAIVTGAASGMGRSTARVFVDEGARLALLDINGEALQVLAAEIQSAGGEAMPLTVDLSSRDAVEKAVTRVANHFGGIDILVNNAGLVIPSEIDAENYSESWDTSLAVMTTAQAWAIRAALPSLRKAAHPRIVNIASTEALGATRFTSSYTVAKHASVGPMPRYPLRTRPYSPAAAPPCGVTAIPRKSPTPFSALSCPPPATSPVPHWWWTAA
jgi:3-oxoacyl-[acyl-carrier protein] reductase